MSEQKFDAHKNFGYGVVSVAPSPTGSGTTLSLSNADAANFPDPDVVGQYNITIWPSGGSTMPLSSNSEIVRITAKDAADSGGVGHTEFTITRIQESSSARSIVAGDQVAITVTAKTLTDVEKAARGGSILIAASNAAQAEKDQANYICDGINDNVEIQAALDSIPSGGKIRLSSGTFVIGAPIIVDIAKGLHLQGTGWATILQAKNALNDYVIKFDTTSLGIWAKFSDFKIEGNAANQTAGGGIYAPGALECIFDGLWIHQPYNWGIFLYSISESPLNYGHNNRIINSVFDNGIDSPGIGGGIYMEHNDENHIHNNDFQFMGGAGARANALADGYAIFDKAGLNSITANAIVNCYNGIQVRDAGNTVIANNVLDRMRFASVMLRGRQNTVRDNIFYQMGANTGLTNEAVGLYIEYYNSQTVDGNWFISDGTNGVTRCFIKDNSDATGGGDSQFTNNHFFIDGTLGTGILEITGASKRNLFANNHGNAVAASGFNPKTAAYTVTPLDKIIPVNATGGAVTITLPVAAYSYQTITIKKTDVSVNAVTVDGNGAETIDGAANKVLADQYDSITLQSDGISAWHVIGSVGL